MSSILGAQNDNGKLWGHVTWTSKYLFIANHISALITHKQNECDVSYRILTEFMFQHFLVDQVPKALVVGGKYVLGSHVSNILTGCELGALNTSVSAVLRMWKILGAESDADVGLDPGCSILSAKVQYGPVFHSNEAGALPDSTNRQCVSCFVGINKQPAFWIKTLDLDDELHKNLSCCL